MYISPMINLQKPLPRSLEKRKAKALQATTDRLVKADVKARDQYRCRCCGYRQELEVHERKTRGAGGKVSLDNSLTLCRVCHVLAQQYRIVIEGPTCQGPLRFVMGTAIAAAIFDHRQVPPQVVIEAAP